jgi:hypothetical protein
VAQNGQKWLVGLAGCRNVGYSFKLNLHQSTRTVMVKVNWGTVLSAVIAGIAILLIQEFAFKRKVSSTGEITSELF